MTATTPDAFDRAAERLADRLNPIIVKEVRQGLRTRVFAVFFTLMLVSCVIISLIAFATTDGYEEKAGQAAFIAYFVALAVVQFFIIPYTAYRSMAREREDETWVLLTLTGLGPRRILFGKLGSSVLQGALYASAAAPFLLFSYFLNGIDLPTIIVSLLLTLALQLFLAAVSVSSATLADSRLVRGLVHFVLLGGLLWALGMGIGGGVALTEWAQRWSFHEEQVVIAAALFFGLVTTALLLFESAASRLALPTERYAHGPRIVYLVQVLGAAGFFAWGSVVASDNDVLIVGAVCISAYLLFIGTAISADVDGMARSHWARGGRWNLLLPGALRGYVLTLLLLVAVLVCFGGVIATDSSAEAKEVALVFAAPLFAMLYLSAPHVVARWLPQPPSLVPVMVRLAALLLLFLGTGLPPLLGAFNETPADPLLNLLNPAVGLGLIGGGKASDVALPVLAGATVVWVLWALVVLRGRDVAPAPVKA